MKERAIALLKMFSNAPGVSGYEADVRSLFARELGGNLETDRTGSVIATQTGDADSPRVMLAAHLDEIGFMVHSITANGFLRIAPLGGWWTHTLPAQRVKVFGKDGAIPGVIAAPPIHLLNEDQKKQVMPIEKLFVDVGADSKLDVTDRLKITVGAPVVPDTTCIAMCGDELLMGKAFDDRAGVALVVQAMQALRAGGHPNTLLGVGTVQEEVGVRGAQTAAHLCSPDVAIVLEGAPADDLPGSNADETQGCLRAGVQIRVMDPTAIMNPKLVELACDVAIAEEIPYQLAVRRSGGTDARAIHLTAAGVPSIVLGIPARYIHSHNSMICVNDYLSALRLLLAMIKKLDRTLVNGLTQFLH